MKRLCRRPGFGDNLYCYTVVHMANRTLLSARDMPQALLENLCFEGVACVPKIGLFCSKSPSSKQLPCGGSGQNIFAQIYPDSLARLYERHIGQIQDEVEKPSFALSNKFGFFDFAQIQKFFVKRTDFKLNADPFLQGKKRKNLSFQRVGPLIEVDRAPIFKKDGPGVFKGLQCLGGFGNCVAAHLSAQFREFFSQGIIAQVMQSNPISFLFGQRNSCRSVACSGKLILQSSQRLSFAFSNDKLDRNSAFHAKKYMAVKNYTPKQKEQRFFSALKGQVSALSIA